MKLKKADKSVEDLKNFIIKNNDIPGFYGDGKGIATMPDVPIKNQFADQLYIRQMDLKKGHVIIGAVHNHHHVWFLLTGRVIINNKGDIVEYIAPCYTTSKPGSQRVILAMEDSVFVNVHKNPSNTQDIGELEKEIVSMTIQEYNNKYK
jgi:hypothetical protein